MRGESGFGQVSVTQNLALHLVYYETLIVRGDRPHNHPSITQILTDSSRYGGNTMGATSL